jgi:hypothetical protein
MASTPFGEKLELVLKVFSMSRAQLAATLAVDKSLVGRWVAGSVTPSAHNMANLTRFVAGKRAGFTMLDWDQEMDGFAAFFGVRRPKQVAATPATDPLDGLPLLIMDQIRAATAARAGDLQCFFRTTRPSQAMPGRFLHDQGMLRMDASGLLEVRMGVRETAYRGWLLPVGGQFFCIATDGATGALIFALFSSLPPGRSQRMDGITLGRIDAPQEPGIGAAPIVLDRIGDLSGDREADDRRYREHLGRDPLAPEGSVPAEVVAQLARDIGPAQLALGGDWLLNIPLARSLARSMSAQADDRSGLKPDDGPPHQRIDTI